jgi:hypothetical protein
MQLNAQIKGSGETQEADDFYFDNLLKPNLDAFWKRLASPKKLASWLPSL